MSDFKIKVSDLIPKDTILLAPPLEAGIEYFKIRKKDIKGKFKIKINIKKCLVIKNLS